MSRRGRGRYLDGTALASRVAQTSQRGFIKSIQRGTIAIVGTNTGTSTVTAVVLANSRLRWLGNTINNAAALANVSWGRISLTNTTTITATLDGSTGADTYTVSWELIEYWPGVIKSVQSGTLTTGGATLTITAVNVAKTVLDYLGNTDSGGGLFCSGLTRLALTNSTTITFSTGSGNTQNTNCQAVEYY